MIKNWFLSLKNFKKTKATKRLTLVIFVLSILSLTVLMPLAVNAGLGDAMTNMVAWILDLIMSLIGALITLVLSVLINIAQFNEFTSATAVTTGWVLVRDICNMFFIVILLVISVGTVLGIQSYSYKNFLKKIIIMAILINFSKTIAGFLIDLSQIIMLTFVAAFRDSIIVGFTEAFGINKLKSLASSMDASGEIEQDNFSLLLGMIFGLIISFILLMALIAIVSMLAYRIVILWILVVLSPFAYLASALPGSLGGQAKQWWSMFSEQLIVGPAIAFFLWLTLSIVSATGGNFTSESGGVEAESIIGGQLATAPFLLNYFLGITLLLVGMDMAKKMGGKSGAAMGSTFDKGMKKGVGFVKSVGKGAKTGGQAAAGFLGGGAIRGAAKFFDAKDGGKNAGSRLHLLAARSEDKKIGRKKSWEKGVKSVQEKILGTGDNVNAALATRGQLPKNTAIAEAIDKDTTESGKLWRKGGEAKDGSGKATAEDIQKKFMQDKHEKVRVEAADKSYAEWTSYSDEEKSEKMSEYGAKTLDGAEKMHRDKAIEGAEDELRGKFGIASGVDLYTPEALQSKGLEEVYLSEKKEEAKVRAEKKYEKKTVSRFNPMKSFYDIAEKTQKDKRLAERKGKILAEEPDRFIAADVEDNIGDIKSKAAKAIFKDMTTEQVDALVKDVNTRADTHPVGTDQWKKAQKRKAALYKSLKHLSDEKVDNDASKYYDANLSSQSVQIGEKSEEIKGLEVKKSTKDYLTDLSVSDQQVLNTGKAIENEIGNLGTKEVVLNKGENVEDRGWTVDQDATSKSENENVVLSKDGELKEISKEEFVKSNSNVLSEQFYNSDRYEKLKQEEGEENILSKKEYDEYAQIRKSSQSGVTMGSLARNGNMSAADFTELDQFAEEEITGEKRGAGIYVKGENAVKAGSAMAKLVQSYADILKGSETDEDIEFALESFGIKPPSLQDLKLSAMNKAKKAGKDVSDLEIAETDEEIITALKSHGEKDPTTILSELKENTLHGVDKGDGSGDKVGGVDNMLKNLNDEEKLRSEGLILVNKARNARDAKGIIRHETAHKDIETIDEDGSMQEEVWNSLTEAEKESARNFIRTDRNQDDLLEEDIKKEYLADALANTKSIKSWNDLNEDEKEEQRTSIKTESGKENISEDEIQEKYIEKSIRDKSKPHLSRPLIDRMQKAGDMKIITDNNDNIGAITPKGSVRNWSDGKQMQFKRKLAEKKIQKQKRAEEEQTKISQEEEQVRVAARDRWSSMNEVDKESFMKEEGAGRYEPKDDKGAMAIYENRQVKGKKTKAEKKLQTMEEALGKDKKDYSSTLANINDKKISFAQTYNENRKTEQSKNTKVSNLEAEAAEARKRYLDPSNTDAKAAFSEYEAKNDAAVVARKAAADSAKKNAKLKEAHDKELKILEEQAQKQKMGIDKSDKIVQQQREAIGINTSKAIPATSRETTQKDNRSSETSKATESINTEASSIRTSSDTEGAKGDGGSMGTSFEEQIQEKQQKLNELKEAESRLKRTSRFANSTKKKEAAGQLEMVGMEIDGINRDIINLENSKNSSETSKATESVNTEASSAKAPSSASRDSATFSGDASTKEASVDSGISTSVSKLSEMASDKNTSSEQIREGLKDLENQITLEMPEGEEVDKDNKQFLDELRKLMAKAENASSESREDGASIIGGDLGQLLSNIPPVMLNAGNKKRESDKGSINIPKQPGQSFLSKPLSMAQFLQMKKWFDQQGGQMKKMGSAQGAATSEMQNKIANLNQRISNIDTGSGDVDMKVVLEDADFSPDEIEQIVEDYTSQQDEE